MAREQAASSLATTSVSSIVEDVSAHGQPARTLRETWPGGKHTNYKRDHHVHRRIAPAAIPIAPGAALRGVVLAPLFRGVSLIECAQIASFARPRSFSTRQTVFREDDPVRSVFVISAGRVKVTQVSCGGKQVILRVDGPGSLIDGCIFSAVTRHSVTAEALESCELLAWDIQRFQRLIRRLPVLQRNATNIVGDRLRMLENRFRELATERVPQRLARTLIRLLSESGDPTRSVPIGLSCEDLAQMIGATLFTVSRLLCEWAGRGIIQAERKAILVESLPALMSLADGEESSL